MKRRELLIATGGGWLWPHLILSQSTSNPAAPASPAVSIRPNPQPRLGEHCDALLAAAIRSPYGYGWNEQVPAIDLTRTRPKGKPPTLDARLTAAAGLVLHLAGEALGEARYSSAAVEAGRGLLSVQTRTGQIRSFGVMGAFGGVKDEATDVPDRRPTCRVLSTLLAILASQPKQDPRLRGQTLKAAHWLAGQQSRAGGWPNLYPPDAAKGEGDRLLVLNEVDHRDTALTVLLASEVLTSEDYRGEQKPERQLQLAFSRAADMLVFSRLNAGLPARRSLWPTMCKLDGDPNTRQPDVPIAVDLLASRYALEALLVGYLVAQEPAYGDALKEALDAISALPRDEEKQWHRRYDLQHRPIAAVAPDTGGTFRDPVASGPPPQATQTPLLFSRLERTLELGAKRSLDEWQQAMPMPRRLAMAVSGFLPDVLLSDATPGSDPQPLPGVIGLIGAMVGAAWDALGIGTRR